MHPNHGNDLIHEWHKVGMVERMNGVNFFRFSNFAIQEGVMAL